jgi:hypothetical protein
LDRHRDDSASILQVHALDVTDGNPGDVHGLTLAGHHRLRRLELALELEEVRTDDRHPARQVEALVGEDVAADEQGKHYQCDDRDEVPEVFLDRSAHR